MLEIDQQSKQQNLRKLDLNNDQKPPKVETEIVYSKDIYMDGHDQVSAIIEIEERAGYNQEQVLYAQIELNENNIIQDPSIVMLIQKVENEDDYQHYNQEDVIQIFEAEQPLPLGQTIQEFQENKLILIDKVGSSRGQGPQFIQWPYNQGFYQLTFLSIQKDASEQNSYDFVIVVGTYQQALCYNNCGDCNFENLLCECPSFIHGSYCQLEHRYLQSQNIYEYYKVPKRWSSFGLRVVKNVDYKISFEQLSQDSVISIIKMYDFNGISYQEPSLYDTNNVSNNDNKIFTYSVNQKFLKKYISNSEIHEISPTLLINVHTPSLDYQSYNQQTNVGIIKIEEQKSEGKVDIYELVIILLFVCLILGLIAFISMKCYQVQKQKQQQQARRVMDISASNGSRRRRAANNNNQNNQQQNGQNNNQSQSKTKKVYVAITQDTINQQIGEVEYGELRQEVENFEEFFSPECQVCLCEFEKEEKVRVTICLHVFHKSCFDTWVKKHGVCPFCRSKITRKILENQKELSNKFLNNQYMQKIILNSHVNNNPFKKMKQFDFLFKNNGKIIEQSSHYKELITPQKLLAKKLDLKAANQNTDEEEEQEYEMEESKQNTQMDGISPSLCPSPSPYGPTYIEHLESQRSAMIESNRAMKLKGQGQISSFASTKLAQKRNMKYKNLELKNSNIAQVKQRMQQNMKNSGQKLQDGNQVLNTSDNLEQLPTDRENNMNNNQNQPFSGHISMDLNSAVDPQTQQISRKSLIRRGKHQNSLQRGSIYSINFNNSEGFNIDTQQSNNDYQDSHIIQYPNQQQNTNTNNNNDINIDRQLNDIPQFQSNNDVGSPHQSPENNNSPINLGMQVQSIQKLKNQLQQPQTQSVEQFDQEYTLQSNQHSSQNQLNLQFYARQMPGSGDINSQNELKENNSNNIEDKEQQVNNQQDQTIHIQDNSEQLQQSNGNNEQNNNSIQIQEQNNGIQQEQNNNNNDIEDQVIQFDDSDEDNENNSSN